MRVKVEGMTCGHCERAVKEAIAARGGTARVDLADRAVDVTGIDDATTVWQAIEDAGYTVVSM